MNKQSGSSKTLTRRRQHIKELKELAENCKGLDVCTIQPLNIPLLEQGERFVKPMSEYTHEASNIKSLTSDQTYSGYLHQEQERQLLEASATDHEPLSCHFCTKPIEPDQAINLHHPVYKSQGGSKVVPAHERCHVEYHSKQGDFQGWGRRSAETRRWAFNLKNVRTNPAYEFDRQYYLMLYAH